MSIEKNIRLVREQMVRAAEQSNRDPEQISLVAVTKTVEAVRIREAVQAGVTTLGENRVQEAESKCGDITADVSWHLIGHLQRNKVKKALAIFQFIHSVDSVKLAAEINKQASRSDRNIPVLLQVNVSGEKSKFGILPEELRELYSVTESMEYITVRGLMTIPPFFRNPEESRPFFIRLRRLLEELKTGASRPDKLTELSMGMTNDFAVAVEEGATMVRVGTAIFGERNG